MNFRISDNLTSIMALAKSSSSKLVRYVAIVIDILINEKDNIYKKFIFENHAHNL